MDLKSGGKDLNREMTFWEGLEYVSDMQNLSVLLFMKVVVINVVGMI